MKDITYGQYFPAKSFVHSLNASVKILLTIAFIVAVFLVKQYYFLGFALCFLFILITTAFAKIPFTKLLSSVRAVVFIVVFSAVLQVFFNKTGKVVFSWRFIKITDAGIYTAIYIAVRILLIVIGASLLTYTTSPVEIADGLEFLLYPLKVIRFPVHEFALIMSIALRFIPTLMNETGRIIKAQKARGADFESGNVFKRAKALIPVLIPLLISAFRRADELADAMDARCYAGSKKRTKFKKATFSFKDAIGFIALGGLITGVVLLNGFFGVIV